MIGQDCFIAENASIIGDVVIGKKCSVWFQAVIRGDVNSIRIGNRVNIQDGAVIHCTLDKSKTIVGDDVSIGHNAILHGCKIKRRSLIGMGAIIMDLAVIEENCIVGAGSVVLENSVLESGFLYAGVPAQKVKTLDPELIEFYIRRTAQNYVSYAEWYR
jgi:carbonic anhydrase/acetyltransferase-like protein (isoleucine patch superfamily)